MLIVSSWGKLKKLSRAELQLLTRALFLLPLTALWIKFWGFKSLYSTMGRASCKYNSQLIPVDASGVCRSQADITVRMVSIASRYGFYRPNCLQRSLVLWWLLRTQGMESDLRIGVRKRAGRFEAHAWVEYAGKVLNDRNDIDRHFAAFSSAIEPFGVKAL
ncbi:MAG TPA: lasso peptide biosynthesis B2 protein [Leptolyngbyaceae cyanobacterium]